MPVDAIRTSGKMLPALVAAVLGLLVLASPSSAQTLHRSAVADGLYKGKTRQENVIGSARTLQIKVKNGKAKLIKEPVVRRKFCLSPPVFTLEGATPRKPLSKRSRFTFTKTFIGTKIDKIKARFTERKRIEGLVVYNFAASEECTKGVKKVKFTLTSGKKKKKKS